MANATAITVITTTANDLETAWGTTRDEWGLLGSTDIADDEQIRFTEQEEGGYVLERHEDGEWYVACDERFYLDELSQIPEVSTWIREMIGVDFTQAARACVESQYSGEWSERCYADDEAVPGTTIYGYQLRSDSYRYGLRITRKDSESVETRLLDRWGGGQSKIRGESTATGRPTREINIYDLDDVLEVLGQCQRGYA